MKIRMPLIAAAAVAFLAAPAFAGFGFGVSFGGPVYRPAPVYYGGCYAPAPVFVDPYYAPVVYSAPGCGPRVIRSYSYAPAYPRYYRRVRSCGW